LTRAHRRRRFATIIAATASSLGLAAITAQQAPAAVSCDRVAAPSGSDSAVGTEQLPLKSAQALVTSLASGQTGCLRGGTYSQDQVKIATPGVTLASFPGERAKLVGRLWIANGANRVTVEGLNLDGRNSRNLPSPTVNASDSVFRDNDVTNGHTAICFNLGHPSYGRADRTTIASNRIHDCGALPATNHHHGIYVALANDTIIRGNVIYGNADRGIQLYPSSQGARITNNVIDGNGEGIIFGGNSSSASSNNVVENNLITNSTLRYNVESSWDGPVGRGNVVRNNCIRGGVRDTGNGGIQSPRVGFTATGNLLTDPGYANRGAGDFTLVADSPCAKILAGASPTSTPPATTTATSTSPVRLSLASHKRKAERGQRVKLTGHASNLRTVEIEVKRNHVWRHVRRDRVRHNRFRVGVRALRSGVVRYRAKAIGSTKTTRAVLIKVVR